MQRWYIARGNIKEGPYSAADLRKLSLAGQISEADMLLLEGSVKWMPASSIKGLFSQAHPELAASAVRRSSSKRRDPWPRRLLKVMLLLLIAGIATGVCWHFVRESQFQNQLGIAEGKVREQKETIAALKRRLADAEANVKAAEASPSNELTSEPPPKEEKKDTEDTSKADAAKAEMAKAREALIAELQQRLADLDRKSRDSAAQVTALEERLAEAVKKEREARLTVETAQKQPAKAEKASPSLIAALKESLGLLRKRLAQAEKDKVPYEFIDKHALDAPKEVAQSVTSLALYLTAPALDDTEKARAIFRWIAANIAYDVDALFSGQKTDNSPEGVLQGRKCVCEGYANLFCALAGVSGPVIVKIGGYGKGWGYEPGEKVDQPNHAWVAVKLDGSWRLIDPTWGAGHTNSEKVYVPSLSEFYFLTPPDQFILSHLPSDLKWQLLPEPVTAAEFEKWGKIDNTFFRYGLTGKQVRDKLSEEGFERLVKVLDVKGAKLTILKAPLDGVLKAGSKFHVQFDAPTVHGISMAAGGKRVPLSQKGSIFEGRIDNLPLGTVTVDVQPSSDRVSWRMLEYTAN